MTQTSAPIEHLNLQTHSRQIREIANSFRKDFGIDLDPPYQRGEVWTVDQRRALVYSWLSGTPIPAIILNDRNTATWQRANGISPLDTEAPLYVCIDGKQRILTVYAWFDNKFGVPASWFAAEDVMTDGPYVRYCGLTRSRQLRFCANSSLVVAEAKVATVQEEAAIYLRVNGGGVPQTDADMANASRVAHGK